MKTRTITYSKDGDKICAKFNDFVDPQKSPIGFWNTEEEAKADLIKEDEKHSNEMPYWAKIMICQMIDDMPHEVLTANLRSKNPFTKEAIDKFIASDEVVQKVQEAIKENKYEIKIFYMICNT